MTPGISGKRTRAAAIAFWFAVALVVAPLVVGLLSSCAGSLPQVAPADLDELATVERAWVAAGLGEPGHCLAGALVRDVSPDEADRLCEHPAYSCLLHEPGHWVIIVSQHSTRAHDVRHEALHALVRCVLRGGLNMDPYDAGHSDQRVWESGGPTSVEQRAVTPTGPLL